MSIQKVSLQSYIMKRLLQAVPLLISVIIINFILIHSAPGDPITILAGEFAATPQFIREMREHYGLDKPLWQQLLIYIQSILVGDLGYSIRFKKSVTALIIERLPATFLLMTTQMVVSTIAGIFLGVASARKQYSAFDNLASAVSLIGYSMPLFWLGQVLMLIFSINLGLFPVQGMISPRRELTDVGYIVDLLHHLTLPALCLSTINLAVVTRLTRSTMLDVLTFDYITTARSTGLDENTILYRHALKNAILPVVTVVGMNFGYILAGSTLTETVFAWPGLGSLIYDAIGYRDYPVLMGMFVAITTMVVVANLVTDILYAFLDPRIRYR